MSERARAILCSAIVYIVWGSSYVVTSIGVHALPPRLFSGVRFTVSGIILLTMARLLGRGPVLGRAELRHGLVMGICSVALSNGFNNWAMQWVPSNQAALLNASTSLWIAGFGAFGARAHALTSRVVVGLALGFSGVALILWPGHALDTTHLVPQAGILIGCISWSLGTIYFRNVGTRLDILAFTGLQMLIGGIILAIAGVAFGETARWSWSAHGLAAMAYLTVFSSCIAYLAFAWLARHVPPAQAGSYGYVNPAIATLLGWLVLGERLSPGQIVGMVVILVGVVLVTWPRAPRQASAARP